jgi:hypothetical protein
MNQTSIWTTVDKNEYVTEMSSLSHDDLWIDPFGQTFNDSILQEYKDNDGDITHWTGIVMNKGEFILLTILND